MDYGKGALVFTTWAIHIHSVTIAISRTSIGGYSYSWDDDDDHDNGKNGRGHSGHKGDSDAEDKDDAVKAFLIIAFLLYLVAFLLQVIMKTGEDLKLSNKIIGIILFILLVIGVVCSAIALFIIGDWFEDHTPAFPTTTYVIAAASAVIAAVFIMLSAVCGK